MFQRRPPSSCSFVFIRGFKKPVAKSEIARSSELQADLLFGVLLGVLHERRERFVLLTGEQLLFQLRLHLSERLRPGGGARLKIDHMVALKGAHRLREQARGAAEDRRVERRSEKG